jgi:ABC-type branched-subunit amino acid transport system substrate-binding protein
MSRRRKRAIGGLLAGVLCLGGLAACGSSDENKSATTGAEAATAASTTAAASEGGGKIDPSKPPVRIPVISIKMPGLDLLTPQAEGAKAAAHVINSQGGFGGREVVIDECATELTPATATVCANRTLEKGDVIAEIGCEVTWAMSGLEIYKRAKVPSLNCANKLSDDWNFGAHPGTFGEHAAVAAWLCERDDVQKVVMLGQDIPQQRREEPEATKPIIEGCGKEIEYVFVPVDATDFTPYVNQVLKHDPDFVITQQSPGPTALMYKAFQQAGFPAEKTSSVGSSCIYEEVLKPLGAAMEGAVCLGGWKPWDDEADSEVAQYVQAMKESGAGYDYRSESPQWGYAHVMWLYEAAKELGFDKATPEALAEYMRTANGVPMPLAKEWKNPGPSMATSTKQPATLFLRWQDGKFNVIEEGTDGGWIDGLAALDAATGNGG